MVRVRSTSNLIRVLAFEKFVQGTQGGPANFAGVARTDILLQEAALIITSGAQNTSRDVGLSECQVIFDQIGIDGGGDIEPRADDRGDIFQNTKQVIEMRHHHLEPPLRIVNRVETAFLHRMQTAGMLAVEL